MLFCWRLDGLVLVCTGSRDVVVVVVVVVELVRGVCERLNCHDWKIAGLRCGPGNLSFNSTNVYMELAFPDHFYNCIHH